MPYPPPPKKNSTSARRAPLFHFAFYVWLSNSQSHPEIRKIKPQTSDQPRCKIRLSRSGGGGGGSPKKEKKKKYKKIMINYKNITFRLYFHVSCHFSSIRIMNKSWAISIRVTVSIITVIRTIDLDPRPHPPPHPLFTTFQKSNCHDAI